MNGFAEWSTFLQIVGSAAGALTGLQFVVMALISDLPMRDGEQQTGSAFAGPTIVHFTAALLLAGGLAMPWQGLAPVRWLCAVGGVAGLVYTGVVVWRMRGQQSYAPVLEDWIFHVALPAMAYGTIVAAAGAFGPWPRATMFALAWTSLLLLADGIHNAWDNVTFLVELRRNRLAEERGRLGC